MANPKEVKTFATNNPVLAFICPIPCRYCSSGNLEAYNSHLTYYTMRLRMSSPYQQLWGKVRCQIYKHVFSREEKGGDGKNRSY